VDAAFMLFWPRKSVPATARQRTSTPYWPAVMRVAADLSVAFGGVVQVQCGWACWRDPAAVAGSGPGLSAMGGL